MSVKRKAKLIWNMNATAKEDKDVFYKTSDLSTTEVQADVLLNYNDIIKDFLKLKIS